MNFIYLNWYEAYSIELGVLTRRDLNKTQFHRQLFYVQISVVFFFPFAFSFHNVVFFIHIVYSRHKTAFTRCALFWGEKLTPCNETFFFFFLFIYSDCDTF